ncbi:hypothetical protein [Apilactobacillus xinyiensis]|uniref:hypothetical protein n=1 Tax=Apilactobacillus xinyiensis TaxID=2841032 RepID=UPI001C7D99B5|nr:hypothetical protein [Apilactobacillus xinyiensis]
MQVKKYGTARELLFNFANSLTLPATVDNPNATVDNNNRKIIKAGTPMGAASSFLMNRDQVLQPSATPDAVLMHDVDVTNGPASATVIIEGDIVLSNADSDVQKMYTDAIVKALPKITFIK